MKVKIGKAGDKNVHHDFKESPVLFVTGETGSGKSNLCYYLIEQVLKSDECLDYNLVLIDCKRVEFSSLREADKMLQSRIYDIDADDISCEKSWNKLLELINKGKIFMVVDEYSDLMHQNKDKFEELVKEIYKNKNGTALVVTASSPRRDIFTENLRSVFMCRILLNRNKIAVYNTPDYYEKDVKIQEIISKYQ
jgi:DNA segregation ATPase FtsK/SpoIIIE-like protein